MKYLIKTLDKKTTSTGKPYHSMTIQDSTGAVYDKVSVWSDFPNFANLYPSVEVEGEMVINDKGYKNLKPPHAQKPNGMSSMMTQKTESIKLAQERKETSIELSSTFRAATDFVVNSSDFSTMDEVEKKSSWLKWRKWFHKNHDNITGDLSEFDQIPF